MNDLKVPDIQGATAVSAWFGRWPSFHDAEVLHLHLNRVGASRLSIHAWNILPEVEATGHYRTEKHAVVTFELEDISDLELSDFSQQNVLAQLDVVRDSSGVHVRLYPSYGIGGRIDAGNVMVSLAPGMPQ
jgi:immunity protein 50 of polymorphic toxin system